MNKEEVERKFKRGIISYEEYENLTNTKNEDTEKDTLYDILFDKLEKEYEDFCNGVKKKTPDEIIDKSYEITVKREFIDELMTMDLYDEEKVIMIKQKDLLNELYADWLDTDVQLGDSLVNTMEDSISNITKYYNKYNNKEISDDRNM